MTVGVTRDLANIASQLKLLGYNVVDYDLNKQPIDALIYTGNRLLAKDNMLKPTNEFNGVLMINAGNMNISTIDSALKRRIYSPLDFC